MESERLIELRNNILRLRENLAGRRIFLFGHCHASEVLADELLDDVDPIAIEAIFDNNEDKWGRSYRGIPIVKPYNAGDDSIVLIVSRFYEAMARQLKELGYNGRIEKLLEYNSFAEYSLSKDTIRGKRLREKRGGETVNRIRGKYIDAYLVFCPLNALGDVYMAMAYLPAFLKMKGIDSGRVCVCVPGRACAKVVKLFGDINVEVLPQLELEAAIQSVIYAEDRNAYIAHQDRPYVVKLHRALYLKKIPLETIYRVGVYGLHVAERPMEAWNWRDYPGLSGIRKGRAVIISPYAKSVTALPGDLWQGIVDDYRIRGYDLFTNVSGDEEPLPGTAPLSPDICEMKSVVERAGIFIGIRSGLCDVIRTTGCKKIALYPDYNYSDTRWKAIDIYSIEGFFNIVVPDGITWKEIKERYNI